jgi:hypothetical protein
LNTLSINKVVKNTLIANNKIINILALPRVAKEKPKNKKMGARILWKILENQKKKEV